uniref:Uncharacterized protein n=1 Tax=Oryza nivara TaxID=4536 RepID=A0A0E0HS97_ORYNI
MKDTSSGPTSVPNLKRPRSIYQTGFASLVSIVLASSPPLLVSPLLAVAVAGLHASSPLRLAPGLGERARCTSPCSRAGSSQPPTPSRRRHRSPRRAAVDDLPAPPPSPTPPSWANLAPLPSPPGQIGEEMVAAPAEEAEAQELEERGEGWKRKSSLGGRRLKHPYPRNGFLSSAPGRKGVKGEKVRKG